MAQRVVVHRPGSWSQLKLESFECPEPVADEVQVSIKASGVNFADVSVRQGHYSSAKQYIGWPITPGFEFAGIIIATGKDVTQFKSGDKVFGITLFGGYSSEITVKSNQVRAIPKNLSFSEAASLPAVFMTAYYATHWLGRLHPGAKVLVHSAAGGVGLALTQILKQLKCHVVGVVGTSSKVAIVNSYGSDVEIDKSTSSLWLEAEQVAPEGYDAIFDANGVSTLKESYKHLRPSGMLFVYGFASMLSKDKGARNRLLLAYDYIRTPRFNPFELVKTNRSVVAFNVSYFFEREDIIEDGFNYIIKNFETGILKPLPVTEYPFAQVKQAHKDLESGMTKGKLVLVH